MGPVLIATAFILLAAVSWYGVQQIPVSKFGGPVGPRSFPIIVTTGLAICGVLLTLSALRGTMRPEDGARGGAPWQLWLFVAGLAINLLLIRPIGYPLASAGMFTCIALAFGASRPLHVAGIGLVFGFAAYAAFRQFLGIHIGQGVLGTLGAAVFGVS